MGIKLNIGSGRRIMPGYTNIDGGDYPGVKHHDITRLPYSEEEVSEIYACHVISYFSRSEIPAVLKEWRRVLKPDGILRLAVPDFDAMVGIYIKQSIPVEKLLGLLYGKMEMGKGNNIYHKTTYTYPSLVTLLAKLGFKEIEEYDWRETEFAAVDDCSKAFFPHDADRIKEQSWDHSFTLMSLNIQCRK
jgi:ubiquinone/menaquinone biosynthesis C-methylase UbiE